MASIKERLGTGIQRISSLSGKKKIILSVIIVLIFVSGSFAAITYLFKESPSYHSPEVDFHVSFINNTTDSYSVYSPMDQFYHINTPFNSYNMSNITVNVYATMPSFAALGDESISVNGSTTNNSIYVQLFNSTLADAHGNIHGVLSKVFHTIIKEYRQIYTKPQEKNISISMTLQADYQFVYQNKMYVYTYYNNIPFDPWNSGFGDSSFNPATFFSDIYFNMNSPPIVIPINNTTSSVNHLHKLRQIGGGGGGGAIRCNNVVTQHVYQYWGPLPIIMADIPLNGSQLDYSLNNLNGNFKTCIQGNSGTSTTTGWTEQTSTSGAWSDSGAQFNNSLRISGTSGSSDPTEYNNMSMIGFGHFEYQMVFTTTQYFYVDGSYCAYAGSSSSYVLKLLNADNGTFDYISGPVSSEFHIPNSTLSAFVKHDWKAFFDNGLTPDQTFSNVPLSSTVNTTTFYFYANAYETTQQKAANLLNYGAMLAAGVAIGLTIAAIAAVPITGGTSLLVLSFTATGLMTAGVSLALGVSASLVQSSASPMFVSGSQLQVNTIFFTNFNYIYPAGSSGSDGPMTISLYQSSSQESMVINGQEYNFNVQSPYVYAADV
jgi:hypothetical protein